MPEVTTEKLKNLEADAKKGNAVPEQTPTAIQGLKAVPEPFRTLLIMVFIGFGTLGGGAAGQSFFGISEEKLNNTLKSQFEAQDKAIDNKFQLLRVETAGKFDAIESNKEEIREALTVLREMDKRLTKIEAKNGND